MATNPNKKALLLRLDPALAASIEAVAARELRSINGQIEWLLREGLKRHGRAQDAPEFDRPEVVPLRSFSP